VSAVRDIMVYHIQRSLIKRSDVPRHAVLDVQLQEDGWTFGGSHVLSVVQFLDNSQVLYPLARAGGAHRSLSSFILLLISLHAAFLVVFYVGRGQENGIIDLELRRNTALAELNRSELLLENIRVSFRFSRIGGDHKNKQSMLGIPGGNTIYRSATHLGINAALYGRVAYQRVGSPCTVERLARNHLAAICDFARQLKERKAELRREYEDAYLECQNTNMEREKRAAHSQAQFFGAVERRVGTRDAQLQRSLLPRLQAVVREQRDGERAAELQRTRDTNPDRRRQAHSSVSLAALTNKRNVDLLTRVAQRAAGGGHERAQDDIPVAPQSSPDTQFESIWTPKRPPQERTGTNLCFSHVSY